MFKKIKPAWLMIVLIILLVVYFVVRYSSNKERNFRDKVLDFDPKAVTEILIKVPDKPEQTHLRMDNNEWKVLIDGRAYRADSNQVSGMLRNLNELVTKRFAGKGKDIWKKYELTDSAAVKVDLLDRKKNIASLMVGKFEYTQPQNKQMQQFRQQQGEMNTYVRRARDKDVYVVDGFLKMTVGRSSDGFRDKNLTGINRQDISKLTFDYPDRKIDLESDKGKWTVNGTPADSMKMIKYLNTIARINSQDFIYDSLQLDSPTHTLTIEGNNFSPIQIKAYPVADTNIQYVVVSSRNPEAYFNGKKAGLFKKLMVDETAFFAEPNPEPKRGPGKK